MKPSVVRAAPAAGKLKVARMDWAALTERAPPAREWVIKDWLPGGHVTVLAGRGGEGKSLLEQTLASALALGVDYIGSIPKKQRVLIWSCEDDHDELWRRQVANAQFFRVPLADFSERLHIIPRVGEDNILMCSDHGRPSWTPAWAMLAEACNDLRVDTLMIDNAGQVFGANENARADVSRFIGGLAGIRSGMTTLLVSHTAKSLSSEFSGSSAWENAARARWYMGKRLPSDHTADADDVGDDAVRYLCRRKANYSQSDFVRLRFINGVLVPEALSEPMAAGAREEQAEAVILSAMAKLATMGKHPTDGKTSPDYLPRLLTEFQLDGGLPRKDLAGAMRRLMIAGRLRRVVVGKYGNRSDRFGLQVSS
ncbi:MAG TPA: AAA family ATPase [Candidatus Desulfobacillus denitrificans]|jgi:RecA-family ATPase|nr:AAA family ATPase [Candidatus Desulfobacillus denitrificans]